MEQIPISVITLVVLSLLFWLFRKLTPVETSQILTDKPIEELRKKYLKFDFVQIALLFTMTAILTLFYYQLFLALADFRISFLDGVVIVVKPFVSAFLLAAMFSAMLTSAIIITYIIKSILKNDWDEYTAYNDLKSGFNTSRVGRIVLKIFATITAILVIAFLDWYSAFRQNDIIINSLFGIGEKTYQYSDIREIRDVEKLEAPNGNIVEDRHYIIIFGDGEKWNSRNNGFANFQKDTEIIRLIEEKTELELRDVEFDRD